MLLRPASSSAHGASSAAAPLLRAAAPRRLSSTTMKVGRWLGGTPGMGRAGIRSLVIGTRMQGPQRAEEERQEKPPPDRSLIATATRPATQRNDRRTEERIGRRMTAMGCGGNSGTGARTCSDDEVGRGVIFSRSLFDRDGDKPGDTTQRTTYGTEERVNDDSGGPLRRRYRSV